MCLLSYLPSPKGQASQEVWKNYLFPKKSSADTYLRGMREVVEWGGLKHKFWSQVARLQILILSLLCCMTVPQSSHLLNGNKTYITELLRGLKELIFAKSLEHFLTSGE